MSRPAFVRAVALLVFVAFALPVAGQPVSAGPVVNGERFVRPIVRFDGRPDIKVVTPAHMPTPEASTGIGPGSQLIIDRPDGSVGCTANFIWTGRTKKEPAKKTTYLGSAGHCFLPEGSTSTHGPDADFDRRFATVYACVSACEFGGEAGAFLGEFVKLGRVAYARQTKDEIDASNDFGIVEIPASIPKEMIRSSVPVWGGPSRVEDVSLGGPVCLYGNAAGFGEVFLTRARAGVGEGLSENSRYWTAFIPSLPGDSGSSLVTCDEDEDGFHGYGAAGILTHIGVTGEPGRILGTTTGRAVEMTKEDAGISLRLVLEDGTEVSVPLPPPLPPGPPAMTPTEPAHPVGVGSEYSWSAGPFTRVATTGQVLGDECSGTEPASEHCDYEFVKLKVPKGGARLNVTVSTDSDPTVTDFDLYVYGPDGRLVGDSAAPGTPPEEVSKVVIRPGVYTVAVNPFAAVEASYTGVVKLTKAGPVPPPVDEFDGEVSVGKRYSWEGDPPLDVNPLFSCAEPAVSNFCDNKAIKVNVPKKGGTLVLDVKAVDEGDDFDVCTITPSGTQTCFTEVGDEHIELEADLSGVYRIGVKAFTAFGTFKGFAALR